MTKQSAGILLYRQVNGEYHVLLAHPGGPFWAKKDVGAWSIPKGEVEESEDLLAAGRREFTEELGLPVPDGELVPLGLAKQTSGKIVHAWALHADLDVSSIKSNTITITWPPKSGKQLEIPEIDRAEWMRLPEAQLKLVPGQVPLLDALLHHLGITADPPQIVPLETFAGPTKMTPSKPSPPDTKGTLGQTSLF